MCVFSHPAWTHTNRPNLQLLRFLQLRPLLLMLSLRTLSVYSFPALSPTSLPSKTLVLPRNNHAKRWLVLLGRRAKALLVVVCRGVLDLGVFDRLRTPPRTHTSLGETLSLSVKL